ncbi:MAG: hypothetical protein ACFFCE_05715 [Promethearchaeota archaeon]
MADEIKHVTENQWSKVDTQISEVKHEVLDILPALPHRPFPEGIKVIKYGKALEVQIHRRGSKFDYDIQNMPNRKFNEKPVMRESVPILIDHQDNDLSATEGVISLLVQEELEARKQLFDWIIEDILFGMEEVPGSEGLLNYTGIQSSGATDKWGDAIANFFTDLETAIAGLKDDYIEPPYTLVLMHKTAALLRKSQMSTSGNNAWKEFLDVYMNFSGNVQSPAIIDKVYFTDKICTDGLGNSETPADDTQCFLLFKNDPRIFYIAETEQVGTRKGIPEKKFEEDIAYLDCWGGTPIIKETKGFYLIYSGDVGTTE